MLRYRKIKLTPISIAAFGHVLWLSIDHFVLLAFQREATGSENPGGSGDRDSRPDSVAMAGVVQLFGDARPDLA